MENDPKGIALCGHGAAVVGEAGFLDEVVVAAGVVGDLGGGVVGVAGDVQGGFREGADEVHVVGDEDERAFVAFEGVDQRVDGEDVEVGGGLVHEQEVRRIDEELDEVEPGFLTA